MGVGEKKADANIVTVVIVQQYNSVATNARN